MEVLFDIIFEILFEVIGEMLFIFLGKLFDRIGGSEKGLKITKIIVYSLIASLLLILLIFSLIYKKGILIALVLGYLVFILLSYYLMFVFKTVLDKPKGYKVIKWIVRIARYLFTISLIVCANLLLEDKTAKLLLIIGSAVGILIYACIDSYTYTKYKERKNIND